MSSSPVFCPECGAPAPFRGTAVTLVCEYCGSTIVRTGVDLRLVGRVSAIVDNGSPILLGSRGRFAGGGFEVLGRLQVGYARGAWNEWYLGFADGETGWLSDALGQLAITRPSAGGGSLAVRFDQLHVGAVIGFARTSFTICDRHAARYLGSEGQLPFVAEPGLTFYSADLRGAGGEFLTLDWGSDARHDRPALYLGVSTTLAATGLHPLRAFQGWPRPSAPAAGAAPATGASR